MAKTKYEVITKKNNGYVKNVSGSSCDKGNWLKKWKKLTKQQPSRCTYLKCSNKAVLGGHLWLKFQKTNSYYFIAPICAKCNSNTLKKEIFHKTKKNITFMRIPFNPCVLEQNPTSNARPISCTPCTSTSSFTARCRRSDTPIREYSHGIRISEDNFRNRENENSWCPFL